MRETKTVLMDINPEDFSQKNGKLIQMLSSLKTVAPSEDELKEKGARDIQDFLDKLKDEAEKHADESETGGVETDYSALLQYGMHTRQLSDDVMGSKFYADGASLIVKGLRLGYIHRRHVRRPTAGQRGNPNLVMNYITSKGRELLAGVNADTDE